jgi:hypothetical protein
MLCIHEVLNLLEILSGVFHLDLETTRRILEESVDHLVDSRCNALPLIRVKHKHLRNLSSYLLSSQMSFKDCK